METGLRAATSRRVAARRKEELEEATNESALCVKYLLHLVVRL